jgi:hypothetical protein
MAAPTNAANVKKVLANSEPSTSGHGSASKVRRLFRRPIRSNNHFVARSICF